MLCLGAPLLSLISEKASPKTSVQKLASGERFSNSLEDIMSTKSFEIFENQTGLFGVPSQGRCPDRVWLSFIRSSSAQTISYLVTDSDDDSANKRDIQFGVGVKRQEIMRRNVFERRSK